MASCIIEKVLRLSGASKEVSAKNFYKKLRKNAIRHKKGDKGVPLFLGVKAEREIYCGMHYFVFVPRSVETDKSIMYIHGSGYMNGYRRIQAKFAAELAVRTHAKVYFPLYPKLPVSTVLPCFALLHNFYVFLGKKGEVFLIGDSSGAALALALAAEREEIRSVIAISPWVSLSVGEEGRRVKSDVTLSLSALDRAARLWAYDLPYENVKLSPINGNYMGKELLIFAGEKEIFCPDIRLFAERKSAEGCRLTYWEGEGQQHCYPLFPTPEGREARAKILSVLQERIYGEAQ